nr:MAG TPA: hypothetical protein [Bacteriophage sp.]
MRRNFEWLGTVTVWSQAERELPGKVFMRVFMRKTLTLTQRDDVG